MTSERNDVEAFMVVLRVERSDLADMVPYKFYYQTHDAAESEAKRKMATIPDASSAEVVPLCRVSQPLASEGPETLSDETAVDRFMREVFSGERVPSVTEYALALRARAEKSLRLDSEAEVRQLRADLAAARSRCETETHNANYLYGQFAAARSDAELWKTTSAAHATVLEGIVEDLHAVIPESTDPSTLAMLAAEQLAAARSVLRDAQQDSERLNWWFSRGMDDSVCEGSVDLWWADEQDGDAVTRVTHGTSVRDTLDKAMRGIYDTEKDQ